MTKVYSSTSSEISVADLAKAVSYGLEKQHINRLSITASYSTTQIRELLRLRVLGRRLGMAAVANVDS